MHTMHTRTLSSHLHLLRHCALVHHAQHHAWQEVTGTSERSTAVTALQRSGWQLETAVHAFFSGEMDGAAAEAFSPEGEPAGLRRRARGGADAAAASDTGAAAEPKEHDAAAGGDRWGWLRDLVTYPFQLVGSFGAEFVRRILEVLWYVPLTLTPVELARPV